MKASKAYDRAWNAIAAVFAADGERTEILQRLENLQALLGEYVAALAADIRAADGEGDE